MASVREMPPSLLVIPAFSRHPEALAWAEEQLLARFGAIAMRSPDFAFGYTTYYEKEMGANLVKRFLVFAQLAAADCLPEVKLFTRTPDPGRLVGWSRLRTIASTVREPEEGCDVPVE